MPAMDRLWKNQLGNGQDSWRVRGHGRAAPEERHQKAGRQEPGPGGSGGRGTGLGDGLMTKGKPSLSDSIVTPVNPFWQDFLAAISQ